MEAVADRGGIRAAGGRSGRRWWGRPRCWWWRVATATTFSSSMFNAFGDEFIATGITFRNTHGPGSQAVAVMSISDRSVFYRCNFEGYQDTLRVFSQRQFYRECNVYGTIDFIFGNTVGPLHDITDIRAVQPKELGHWKDPVRAVQCHVRVWREFMGT